MDKTQKAGYLLRSIGNMGQKKECPFCNGHSFQTVDRKYLFTQLLKCDQCSLLHRHPRDSMAWLKKFYQVDYQVDVEMMTSLPDEKTLAELKASNFEDLRDFSDLIAAATSKNHLTGPVKVVDYGCSWGYNVFKLRQAGMDARGYELSAPRAKYGAKNLEIEITSKLEDIPGNQDVIFSSHVIEHLGDIQEFIDFNKQKLVQNGVFMAFCPNGSPAYQRRDQPTFHVTWGMVHPNYLTIDFARYAFRNNPYLILTSDWPYNTKEIYDWDGESQVVSDYQEGYELLIIAKPNITILPTT